MPKVVYCLSVFLLILLIAFLPSRAFPAANIAAGTQITVRTVDRIQSKKAEVGQSYRCTVDAPVRARNKVIVDKGADCVLRIVEMKEAGKLKGNGELKLELSAVRVGGNLVDIDSDDATVAGNGKGKSTAVKTGVGAAAGAGLGALLGGKKGALIGGGVGAGAGVAASALTQGPEIKVAPETVLNFVVR